MDRDPDSIRWQVDAEYILEHLNLEIGDQPFEEWAELVWPGDSIINFTWKQISKMAIEALDAACKGVCEIEELARAAKYPEEPAPARYGIGGSDV